MLILIQRVEGKFLPEAQYNQNYIACSNKISAFTNHSVNQLKSIPVYHCYDSYGLYLKINSVNSANNVSIIYRYRHVKALFNNKKKKQSYLILLFLFLAAIAAPQRNCKV